MSVTVVLFALMAIVDAMSSVEQCPKGCSCKAASSDSHLSVNCSQKSTEAEQLYQQLESMLSADHFRERLESLSITNTPLTRVPASICQLLNLTTLRIERNRPTMTALPDNCFTKLKKLVTLSLYWNKILSLQDGLFDGLQSLQTLDLSHNYISHIGLRVFSNASDLTSLRTLNLSWNELTSLEPWWYYRCIHGISVNINLKSNSISKFTNELKFDFQCGMKRPTGYLDLSHNNIVHVMDIIQGWNIADIGKLFCIGNINGMASYNASHTMHYNLDGYAYDCDCIDYPVYKYGAFVGGYLPHAYCNKKNIQAALGGDLPATAIPLIEFVCEVSDHCPSSCRCVYRPANATLHVYCSSANISSLPFHLPPLPKSYVKYKLDFSNNKLLRRLEHRPYFVNTSVLDISNCAVSTVDISAWRELAGMRSPFVTPRIYLHNNKLTSVPFEVTGIDSSSVIFALYNNPWECSCANQWMISWFKTLSLASSNGGNVLCTSPSRLKGRSITQCNENEFCIDPAMRMLQISLSSSLPPMALFVMVVFAVYRVRVRLYRRWKFHPFDRDECVGEDLDYDVFLCCSSDDDRPHGRRILERIEANGYRVCYHERDFLPGQLITDNMGHGIERSKRTVCLISNNFLRR